MGIFGLNLSILFLYSLIFSTIILYLTGIDFILKVHKKKTINESSIYTFLFGFISCIFSLNYGFLLEDKTMIIVNIFGATFEAIYTAILYQMSHHKVKLFIRMVLLLFLTFSVLTYIKYSDEKLKSKLQFQGIVCCICNLLTYVAPLINTIESVRKREDESLSVWLLMTYLFVSTQWFIYGYTLHNIYIEIPNMFGIIFGLFQMIFYINIKTVKVKNYSKIQINHLLWV